MPHSLHPSTWSALLDLDQQLEGLGFHILTPQARIVAAIVEHGPINIKQAMIASKLSYRGFYLAINVLTKNNVITVSSSSSDRRTKAISLNEEFLTRWQSGLKSGRALPNP